MNPDPQITTVIVCVDYSDLLAVTLPWNSRFFSRVIVVTTPSDLNTIAAVELARIRGRNVDIYATNVFYANGASFNKGAALSRALESIANPGWLAVMDADILLPPDFAGFGCVDFQPGTLYVPHRRMLADPAAWHPKLDWSTLPLRNEEPGGWLQIFHASDPVLAVRPWYPDTWKHAGGCDSAFWLKWGRGKIKRITEFEVLHLGEDGKNWHGRVTPFIDGTTHPRAAEHAAAMQSMMDNRKSKRGGDRFAAERLDGKGGLR